MDFGVFAIGKQPIRVWSDIGLSTDALFLNTLTKQNVCFFKLFSHGHVVRGVTDSPRMPFS
eukprot:158945-Amphidinium_carterae.2